MTPRGGDAADDDVEVEVEVEEGVAPPTGSLEAEGIPEIQGSPPGEPTARDGDEGFIPPGDTPWAADHDVTATALREGGTLDERLALEEPERATPPGPEGIDIVDEDRPDDEPDLVGTAADPSAGASAEEAAMRVVDDAPGATDDEDDDYVAEDGGIAP